MNQESRPYAYDSSNAYTDYEEKRKRGNELSWLKAMPVKPG